MFLCKLPIEGFNACLFTLPNGTYHGTIRRQHVIGQRNYPEVLNNLFLFHLDSNFQLVEEPRLVQDVPGRMKHRSWTEGLEDARILEPGLLFAVACDTNPHWKPEMVAVQYDPKEAKLLSIQPLTISGQTKQTEKNWLLLRRWGDEAHVLHWLNPVRVLRLKIDTGLGSVLVEHPPLKVMEGQEIHCGALLRIPEGFLVTARVKENMHYKHSLWLLLDADSYALCAVSEPFRFDASSETNFEMCMSLLLRDTDELLACVSLSDMWSGVWMFSLQHILKGLRPVSDT